MNRSFDGVDIDLLADYIGGALDGTPEHATVEGLIARDENWRTAYSSLAEGMASVGTSLSAVGAEPVPMPTDVAERLERAFTGPRLVVTSSAARARRARRWAVPIAVAAVALAFAGFGVNYVLGLGRSGSTSSATSSSDGGEKAAPQAASGQALAALPPASLIVSSGTNYRHSTLAGAPPLKAQSPATNGRGEAATATPARPAHSPANLLACLNAIAEENGAGPITVQSVDYARYAGAPAVVVRFTAGNGSWAWASGPDCGAPGVGASRLDAAKVG